MNILKAILSILKKKEEAIVEEVCCGKQEVCCKFDEPAIKVEETKAEEVKVEEVKVTAKEVKAKAKKPKKGFQNLQNATAKKINPKTGKRYGKAAAGRIFGAQLKKMKASGKITQRTINARRKRNKSKK